MADLLFNFVIDDGHLYSLTILTPLNSSNITFERITKFNTFLYESTNVDFFLAYI